MTTIFRTLTMAYKSPVTSSLVAAVKSAPGGVSRTTSAPDRFVLAEEVNARTVLTHSQLTQPLGRKRSLTVVERRARFYMKNLQQAENSMTREDAAIALAKLGRFRNPLVVPTLVQALQTETDKYVLAEVLFALGELGGENVLVPLKTALGKYADDNYLYCHIQYVSGRIRSKREFVVNPMNSHGALIKNIRFVPKK